MVLCLERPSALSGTNAPYTGLGLPLRLKLALVPVRERLGRSWRIWRGAFRSCLGHIRTQSAKGQVGALVGPHGHLGARNARTLVRTLYTQKLAATRPWVDSQDLEIFLMGFDAGEQWILRKQDKEVDKHTESES